jgi:sterol O-acyltransferase
MVFATLFTRDAKTLAISDAVLVCSTFVCVPFVKALQKGYIQYYYTGQTILHIYQMITLALAIQWTFNREWPWVRVAFFSFSPDILTIYLGAIWLLYSAHPRDAYENLLLRCY